MWSHATGPFPAVQARLADRQGIIWVSFELTSEVFKGTDLCTGQNVAIKIVELDAMGDELDEMQREIYMLSQLKNPNITRYYASYLHGTQLWIIIEYCGGGSCFDLARGC